LMLWVPENFSLLPALTVKVPLLTPPATR
jgi:hypothetical protein